MWLILSSRKAGFISSFFVCLGLEDSWQPPIYLWWTSISLCKAGRQREERLTSSAGWGQGWAIVMNIMCKYERGETKGRFCYGNGVIGADWVLICCVCMSVCTWVHTCVSSCMHAGNKILWFLVVFAALKSKMLLWLGEAERHFLSLFLPLIIILLLSISSETKGAVIEVSILCSSKTTSENQPS